MKKLIILMLFLTLSNAIMGQSKGDIIEIIKVSGVAEVFFTNEDANQEIRRIVSVPPSLEVIVNFRDGLLEVDTKGEANNEVVQVYVSSRHLRKIVVEDRAQFHGMNHIESKNLVITLDDFGAADMIVYADNLDINMNGGDLTISGESNNWTVSKGNDHERGTLDSENLIIKN
ncbi:MAG: hypothetical protein COA50_00490 [Flavobacteriaceae bacterium]|nr:MAG: hypothetical protein COA50_00490 [Flavobacteriaceae bacterium]